MRTAREKSKKKAKSKIHWTAIYCSFFVYFTLFWHSGQQKVYISVFILAPLAMMDPTKYSVLFTDWETIRWKNSEKLLFGTICKKTDSIPNRIQTCKTNNWCSVYCVQSREDDENESEMGRNERIIGFSNIKLNISVKNIQKYNVREMSDACAAG